MSTLEFTNQYEKFHDLLFGFSMKITRNVEDARDLLQEATFRAFRNRERFKTGTNFRAWMATIIKNTFINKYRKDSKRKDLELPIDQFLFALENRKVGNEAEGNLMLTELQRMLNDLKEAYRLPFTMFYQGYHYDEIAEQMDIPIGTVKSRIFYARQQLKSAILERYGKRPALK